VGLVGGLVTYSQVVDAAPQPTIRQVTAQVSALTTKENKAGQAYDLVNQQLQSASANLKQVEAQESKDQAQFDITRTDIAQVAAAAYEDGNMTSMVTVLTTDNPQDVLSKASMLVQISSDRSSEMRQFIQAARQLNGAQEQEKRTEAAIMALRTQSEAQLHPQVAQPEEVPAGHAHRVRTAAGGSHGDRRLGWDRRWSRPVARERIAGE
jgi:septal ring factor EnvC (AmiA/AmiB activator)